MNIAIELVSGDEWKAGVTYPKAIFHALQYLCRDVDLCLLLRDGKGEVHHDFKELRARTIRIQRESLVHRTINYAMGHFFAYDLLGSRVMRQYKIDCLFGLLLQRRYGETPTLSWMGDFQHVHLPRMFDPTERDQRDQMFLKSANVSSRVILMSESHKKDFEAFLPRYASKGRVIKAVSSPPPATYSTNPEWIVELYHLPKKFIYLPTQFWKHKNHLLALDALSRLKRKGTEISLVCSGYPGDYRHAGYFASLLSAISKLSIRNQVVLLGPVPQDHVFTLMRQAICVLNPSLFEGFSLTVDEARGLGKRMLLSDIPAHREQNPPRSSFFDPTSCEDLAQKLSEIWNEAQPGPDFALEAEARQSLPERRRACAESLMSVLREVVA